MFQYRTARALQGHRYQRAATDTEPAAASPGGTIRPAKKLTWGWLALLNGRRKTAQEGGSRPDPLPEI
ncbi:MAG TPA: hypothetical protein VF377_11375 [Acidimicrobiia bacterium]